MSVDLSLILPNDCHDLRDNAQALETFNKTILRIQEYFSGHEGFVEDVVIYNSDAPDWSEYYNPDEDAGEYSFELPIINATCHLQQGYWDIWINSRYSHYFWPYAKDLNGNVILWPRHDAFDLARIFGCSEGWICDEYHSWNSSLCEEKEASFKRWCIYGENKQDAKVYEFDLGMFEGRMDRMFNYHSKYHDHFKECHDLLALYECMHPGYKILAIGSPSFNFLLACKGKELYVLNVQTGESLTPFSIDCCHANFNGAGFTVSKGEEKAFFNMEGKQLTDFRQGDFSWRWLGDTQVIIDHASESVFLRDGTKVSGEILKQCSLLDELNRL